MKSRLVFASLLAALVQAVSPSIGLAQNIGFQVGIAPPLVPAQVATHGTFTFVPTFIPPVQPIIGLSVPLVPNFPTVIVPTTVLVPGQTFIPPVSGVLAP